jgi:O-antigen/teichoic acid export membrane protein
LFLGFVVSATGALVPLGANFWFFKNTYPRLAPSFRSIDLVYTRDLLGLGVQFFILQISGLIVFSTANIIIAQLFGPSDVTTYNIAFKYYGIALTGFMILLTPFWSAFTDAYVRMDFNWIRRAVQSLIKYWLLLCIGVVVMTIVADRFYLLWVGTSVQVPFELSLLMGIYVIIFAWSNIFAFFVNGTGKIRLMIWSSVIVALINIPLSIFLAKNLGLKNAGVVLGSCISLLPGCIMWPMQMRKLLRGRAKGIWAR